MTRRPRSAQAGFTLIELMISLVMSSLLVAMIITVYTSMSQGYRVQQQVAEVQQVLGAAQDMISADLRQVGLAMPQGFAWAGAPASLTPPAVQPAPALNIIDGGTTGGPDELRVFYADPTAQARVVISSWAQPFTAVTVDSVDRFAQGDLVVLTYGSATSSAYDATVSAAPEEPPLNAPARDEKIAVYRACVLQLAGVSSGTSTLQFATTGPWGTTDNAFCKEAVSAYTQRSPSEQTNPLMVYRLVAHAYRIDTTRPALGVLQLSGTGGLMNDWQDLGIGFTDLQIASRWYEGTGGVDNTDLDTDPKRNWYSDAAQGAKAIASAPYPAATPQAATVALRVSISLVARTTSDVVGSVVTDSTPNLVDTARPGANEIGNHAAGAALASRIYRYTTFKVDVRNLGTGR